MERSTPRSRACVEDEHAESADELLDRLSPRNQLWSDDPAAWIYRGQANAEWPLIAKAARDINGFEQFGIRHASLLPGHNPDEHPSWSLLGGRMRRMLLLFLEGLDRAGLQIPAGRPALDGEQRTSIQSFNEPDETNLPLLALAQHHGLPTLLLDWTRRAYVGAYFAAATLPESPLDRGSRLAVWALRRGGLSHPTEGPHFHEVPAGTNPNLHAQAGLFTTLGHDCDPATSMEEHFATTKKLTGNSLPLRRLTLPVEHAPRLLRLLSYEGVTGASMFPGADGVVKAMRETQLWDHPPE